MAVTREAEPPQLGAKIWSALKSLPQQIGLLDSKDPHYSLLDEAISSTVFVLLPGSMGFKAVSGDLNPDFWGDPRIILALGYLKQHGAEVDIWTRPLNSMPEEAKQEVKEKVLVPFAKEGLGDVIHESDKLPTFDFQLSDGFRFIEDDIHKPWFMGTRRPYDVRNVVHRLDPPGWWGLNSVIRQLEYTTVVAN